MADSTPAAPDSASPTHYPRARTWVKIDADFRGTPKGGALSTDAYTLYLHSAGYVSKWGIDEVTANLCRMALGRQSPKVINELVSAGLWLPAGERSYKVAGEGRIWRRGKPLGRPRRSISEDVRIAVYRRDNFSCQHCGSEKNLSIDHIYPHSLGGSDRMENLQTLCRPCNSRKGARV